MEGELIIVLVAGGFFALLLGRSAVIAIWPHSALARFCAFKMGFLDKAHRNPDGAELFDGGDGGGGD